MSYDKIFPDNVKTNQGNSMLDHSDANKIITLHSMGWGAKKIAKELGISRRTVRKYIRLGKWVPPVTRKTCTLAGLEPWLRESFEKHSGNADVVRQELITQHGIKTSLRTVQRAVQEWRREAEVKAKATVRFETPPGKQLQIDFGSTKVLIANEPLRVYLFVATLAYSRRIYIEAFLHERQTSWFRGVEGAFAHFGGIPDEVLLDNAKALVTSHDPVLRVVVLNDRFMAFAKYWGFRPKACAPYRARTKGKDERSVGYVKHNAVAGHSFNSFEAFQRHLQNWNAQIADVRTHGSTGEKPLERFLRDEAMTLHPLVSKPPFIQVRELDRKVHADSCVEVDTNHYSVPSRLIDKQVLVQVANGAVIIFDGGDEVAAHVEHLGQRHRSIIKEHLKGIVGAFAYSKPNVEGRSISRSNLRRSELARPLADYEAVVGGGW